MEINELFIGAWVLNGGIPAQVTGITCDGILETTAYRCTNIERIEPIPLTPEILEKNGFEKGSEVSWMCHEHYSDIGVTHPDDGFYFDIFTEGVTIDSLRRDYVHELQHALRVVYIDKEIIL